VTDALERPTAVADLFAELDADEVQARIDRAWELVDGWIPLPRWRVRCPGDPGTENGDPADPHGLLDYEVVLSRVHFNRRKGPTTFGGRADVVLKCSACSLTWTHGIPVDAAVVERATRDHGHTWRWRELLAALGGRDRLNLRAR
jgi:hypothetical protein